MHNASRLVSLFLLCCLLLPGCGDKTKSPAADNGENGEGGADAEAKVKTVVLDYDGLSALIESKKGRIVVLDCWATWCDPCKKELPGLGEIVKAHDDQVAGITVSVDFSGTSNETPEQHRVEVEKFLNTLGDEFLAMDHIISKLPFDESSKHEALKAKLGLEKGAVVPVVIVFDREGKAVKTFDAGTKEFTYAKDVTPFVNELVAKP